MIMKISDRGNAVFEITGIEKMAGLTIETKVTRLDETAGGQDP